MWAPVRGFGEHRTHLLTPALFPQFALGFKAAHLEGVELKHMGQQLVGQYPIHFHLAGDVDEKGGYDPPTYVRGLSIHHTFSRCITVHGSNGLLVSNPLSAPMPVSSLLGPGTFSTGRMFGSSHSPGPLGGQTILR